MDKEYLIIHLKEKVKRLSSIYNSERRVRNESIEDTLKDLANYSIMGIIQMENTNEEL